MLDINGLSICYGSVEVVHGVAMHIEQGKIVALIGPNGAGKSSVLRAVSGLIHPTSGDIVFLGASLIGMPPHEIAATGIAHVMEGRHLFGGLTVEDNLLLGGSSDVSASAGSMEDLFQRWPILGERCHQLAGTLSGGEQQLLAIGRALIPRPRLLMLDEPSWGLAPKIVRQLMQTITELRSEGMTILLVEQMAKIALKICDYGYVMSNGRIVLEGSSQELLSNPELHASYLGGEVSMRTPEEEKAEPLQKITEEPTDMPKPAERMDHGLKEIKRQEREKRKRELISPSEKILQFQREELPKPDQEIFKEREKLRAIRQQSFGSDQLFSDLKEELGQLSREVSDLKEVRTTPEDKIPLIPPYGKKSRRTFEKHRQERQAAWESEKLPEPVAEGGQRRSVNGKEWSAREAVRRERQASLMRGTSGPPPSKKLHLAEREGERQKRQEQWSRKSQKETKITSETRLPNDRKHFEMKRREREGTQWLGGNMKFPLEKTDKEQIDRKSRELARQQRQSAMQKSEKGTNPNRDKFRQPF